MIEVQIDHIDALQQKIDEQNVRHMQQNTAKDRGQGMIERLREELGEWQRSYAELRGYTNSIIDLQAPVMSPNPGCIYCGHGAIHATTPPNFPAQPSIYRDGCNTVASQERR